MVERGIGEQRKMSGDKFRASKKELAKERKHARKHSRFWVLEEAQRVLIEDQKNNALDREEELRAEKEKAKQEKMEEDKIMGVQEMAEEWASEVIPEVRENLRDVLDWLEEIWGEEDLFELNVWKPEELKNRWEEIQAFEDQLFSISLKESLEKYGIDTSKIEITESGRVFLPVTKHFSKERLPKGYSYIGGAARSLLEMSLGVLDPAMPRDIDIVRTAYKEPEQGLDDKLSREFMAEDYKFGHGVREMHDYDTYFAGVDFTINAVIATDTEIIATPECVLDTVRRIIRTTPLELAKQTINKGSKSLAKGLRLYAGELLRWKFEHEGAWERLPAETIYQMETAFIPPFFLALQLDKTFEIGGNLPQKFTDVLRKNGFIPENIKSSFDLVYYLDEELKGRDFYFRYVPMKLNVRREDDYPIFLLANEGLIPLIPRRRQN